MFYFLFPTVSVVQVGARGLRFALSINRLISLWLVEYRRHKWGSVLIQSLLVVVEGLFKYVLFLRLIGILPVTKKKVNPKSSFERESFNNERSRYYIYLMDTAHNLIFIISCHIYSKLLMILISN